MSRAYPIWNNVTACIYKGAKSYGVRENGTVEVRVGTSASNSHLFLTHTVTHRQHANGDREYRFYINGKLITSATLAKGAAELDKSSVLLGSAYHNGAPGCDLD